MSRCSRPSRWRTLSFAIIGNETRYHSPGDTVEALDSGSLYHMGSEVLAAARTSSPRRPPVSARWAYADIAGRPVRLRCCWSCRAAGGLLIGGGCARRARKALGRPLVVVSAAAVAAGIAAASLPVFLAGVARAGDYWRA